MPKPPAKQPPPPTAEHDTKRDELADRIATIILANGLEAFALRGLAEQLATSGRMLLYYFTTKDALITATLRRISQRLDAILTNRATLERRTPGKFLQAALDLSADPTVAPYVRVWTEIVARGSRGEKPFDAIAQETIPSWLDWIGSQLAPTLPPDNLACATAILAIVEGTLILEAARPGSTTSARAYLSNLMDTTKFE